MSVGGTNVSDPNTVAKITVAVPRLDIASVRVRASSKITCGSKKTSHNGKLPQACFFNVTVTDPYYTDKPEHEGRMQFRTRVSPLENLSAAFLKL